MSTTFTVRGQQVRSRSPRRYLVVGVRPEPRVTEQGTFVAFARVLKRTDSKTTADREASRYGRPGHGAFAVVVDAETGQEVD